MEEVQKWPPGWTQEYILESNRSGPFWGVHLFYQKYDSSLFNLFSHLILCIPSCQFCSFNAVIKMWEHFNFCQDIRFLVISIFIYHLNSFPRHSVFITAYLFFFSITLPLTLNFRWTHRLKFGNKISTRIIYSLNIILSDVYTLMPSFHLYLFQCQLIVRNFVRYLSHKQQCIFCPHSTHSLRRETDILKNNRIIIL